MARPSCRPSLPSCASCCTAFTPCCITMRTTTEANYAPPEKERGFPCIPPREKKLEIKERIFDSRSPRVARIALAQDDPVKSASVVGVLTTSYQLPSSCFDGNFRI